MQKQHRQRGTTLLELAIVGAVAAVIFATVAPNMRGLIETRRLDGAAAELATDIQFVRSEAVARNQPVRVSFHASASGSCYVLHTGAAAQCVCGATAPAQCSGDAVQIKTVLLPAGEKISLVSNAASILFDPLHGTSTPSATLRVLGTQGRAVHHVVNVMGRVRSCSPLATMPGYPSC